MTKEIKTGAAPVSKYAAKKAARAKAVNESIETKTIEGENSVEETTAEVTNTNVSAKADVEETTTETTNAPTQKPIKDKKSKVKGIAPAAANYPEHVVAIALIIKNNAEIRRFTALGILNYLLQKGEIKGDNRYVSFKWNKFAVKCNGLMREYSYTEPFFINALVASFNSFSASAQRTIDAFCHKEMSVSINKAVDREEVETITALNEEYQGNVSDDDE